MFRESKKNNEAKSALLDAHGATNIKGWGLVIINPATAIAYGSLPGQIYGQPGYARCEVDPVSHNAIVETQRLFPNNLTSATGGARGASSGGAGPLIAEPSVMNNALIDNAIVGYVDRGGSTPYHAFRWTNAGGMTDLGTLDPPNNATKTSLATGVNANGSVVVGYSETSAGTVLHAFRWTSGGMIDLGAPAGATRDSRALAVNAAGDVVVGDGVFVDAAAFTGFRSGAFRWTSAGGFQNLGALEPGFFSVATDVSADGSVVVGQGGTQVVVGGSSINGSRAFRWTQATGLQAIGPLPGHSHAIALSVSDNGKVVVGTSANGPLSYSLIGPSVGTAFRWTQAGGIRELRQLLIDEQVDMTGITLVSATGMSADGQWIVGEAITPSTPSGERTSYTAKYCDADIGGACTPIVTLSTATFALTSSTSSALTVAAGASVTSTLTVTPSGGFNQPVTFTCSGLPAESSCTFAPASVTPVASAVTTTLTISTSAPHAVRSATMWPLMVVLVLAGLSSRAGSMSRARRGLICLIVVGASTPLVLGACGGGDKGTGPQATTGGTPAGSFPLTVTATSGSGSAAVSRTVSITLNVTR